MPFARSRMAVDFEILVGGPEIRALPLQHEVEGEFQIIDGHGPAVVEFHVRAQLDVPGAVIDLGPRFRGPRDHVQVLVHISKPVIDHAADRAHVVAGVDDVGRLQQREIADHHALARGLRSSVDEGVEGVERADAESACLHHAVPGLAVIGLDDRGAPAELRDVEIVGEHSLRVLDQLQALRVIGLLRLRVDQRVVLRVHPFAVVAAIEAVGAADHPFGGIDALGPEDRGVNFDVAVFVRDDHVEPARLAHLLDGVFEAELLGVGRPFAPGVEPCALDVGDDDGEVGDLLAGLGPGEARARPGGPLRIVDVIGAGRLVELIVAGIGERERRFGGEPG